MFWHAERLSEPVVKNQRSRPCCKTRCPTLTSVHFTQSPGLLGQVNGLTFPLHRTHGTVEPPGHEGQIPLGWHAEEPSKPQPFRRKSCTTVLYSHRARTRVHNSFSSPKCFQTPLHLLEHKYSLTAAFQRQTNSTNSLTPPSSVILMLQLDSLKGSAQA